MHQTALFLAVTAVLTGTLTTSADAQSRRERFRLRGQTDTELGATVDSRGRPLPTPRVTEAPTGFDNLTNGFLPQGAPFDTIEEDNVVPLRSFNDNRFIFEEVEHVDDGLGPTYNAQSCGECHQNVATGGASQIAEHRTGTTDGGRVLRVAGRLAHSLARDASGHRGARRLRGRHPHVPDLDEYARRRIRGSHREHDPARDSRAAARRDSRVDRYWSRCSKRTAGRASADSAGRTSMRASCRSRPMRT